MAPPPVDQPAEVHGPRDAQRGEQRPGVLRPVEQAARRVDRQPSVFPNPRMSGTMKR